MAEDAELEAALSLLEDFEPLESDDLDLEEAGLCLGEALDCSGFALGTSSTSASEKPNNRRSKPAKKQRKRAETFNPNRARDERKEELVYLRAKVVEMEQQLTQLQTNEPTSAADASAMRVRDAFPSEPSASVWQEIATRQDSERRKSEMENIRLRLLLEGQIKVAKGLERALKKRSSTQTVELYVNGRVPRRSLEHLAATDSTEEKLDDAATFESLLADLEQAVLDVDDVFEANGLSRTESAYQDAQVRNDSAKGTYLEVCASKIMPFDLHATADAVWRHLIEYIDHMPFRCYYKRKSKQIEAVHDTVFETFDIELYAKRTKACFRVHQVVRRHMEEDRIVIAWRMIWDPIEYASKPATGLRFVEQCYVVIRRPKTASQDYALMQTCFLLSPERTDSTSEFKHKVGQISSFFLDSNARYIFLSHQMVENCLLEQAARQKTGAASPLGFMSLLLSEDEESLGLVLSFLDHLGQDNDDEDDREAALFVQAALAIDKAPVQAREGEQDITQALDVGTGQKAQAQSTTETDGASTKRKTRRSRTIDFNPNRVREERKRELMYLRNKVLEMDRQLQELKLAGGASSRLTKSVHLNQHLDTSARQLRAPRVSPKPVSCSCVWEEAASRQSAERHRSELENLRLKSLLQGQIKLSRALEKLLHKRSNTQFSQLYKEGEPDPSKRQTYRRTAKDSKGQNELEIFLMLFADLEKALQRMPVIFESNGLSGSESAFQNAAVRSSRSQGMYLEVVASKIMPFDLHATGNAVWQHLARYIERMPYRAYYERGPKMVEPTEHLIVESFIIELNVKQTVAQFQARQVMKRIVERDRILITWRQTIDPIEQANVPQWTSAARFLEQGFVLIKRPTITSDPESHSLMQTCFHLSPDRYDKTPEAESNVRQLAHYFMDSLVRYIYLSHQMIENQLLDQTVLRHKQQAEITGRNS